MRFLLVPPLLCLLHLGSVVPGQDPGRWHGKKPATVEIRNVHVVRGDGAPATGPTSVYLEDSKIASGSVRDPELVIDGSGGYLLPGLVSTHAHLHDVIAGVPIEIEYICNLWLACGITSIRDVGSNFRRSISLRSKQEKGELAAPRIFLYRSFGQATSPEQARQRVASFKSSGADGIKLHSNLSYPKKVLEATLAAARKAGLRTTAHIGVGESNAVTYAEYGVGCIEHWYGVPDAALVGVQNFPSDFSYSDETKRFRYGGRLWRETSPRRLDEVLAIMVENQVTWSPTLAIYEASRDLLRAQNKPWFQDQLHPALQKFFTSGKGYHGSYFQDWTSTDEAHWKENYRLWMDAILRFDRMGGNITTGEDAGYIYVMYGYGLIRELELHQEAGFHPLEVIRHATYNGAKALGKEQQFGRILPGMSADLVLVRGNPLRDLKVLYPFGGETKGALWTIVRGRLYHGPTLMDRVRQIVTGARKRRG